LNGDHAAEVGDSAAVEAAIVVVDAAVLQGESGAAGEAAIPYAHEFPGIGDVGEVIIPLGFGGGFHGD